eukprot:365721-Chlamydomonas_euryale.AAC.13
MCTARPPICSLRLWPVCCPRQRLLQQGPGRGPGAGAVLEQLKTSCCDIPRGRGERDVHETPVAEEVAKLGDACMAAQQSSTARGQSPP